MRLTKDVFKNNRGIHPRLHAKELDKFLGYKITKIENKLVQKYRAYDNHSDETNRKRHFSGAQAWIGLHPQILQTPYCEILSALSLFQGQRINRVVDIGAGYGRVGLISSTLFPEAQFLGYEIVKPRQREGQRVFEKYNLENCDIAHKNVLSEDFELPQAEIYFLYDFSREEDVSKLLKILSSRIRKYSFSLIVSGDRVTKLLKTTYSKFWKHSFPVEESKLSVYPIFRQHD